jgi:hypothetical protein
MQSVEIRCRRYAENQQTNGSPNISPSDCAAIRKPRKTLRIKPGIVHNPLANPYIPDIFKISRNITLLMDTDTPLKRCGVRRRRGWQPGDPLSQKYDGCNRALPMTANYFQVDSRKPWTDSRTCAANAGNSEDGHGGSIASTASRHNKPHYDIGP